jgi:salicylate hydroxylase
MASQQTENFSVAVIGGGIGGLTLALGLLEVSNIDVQVYEAAKEFGEVGLGVNIAPNSQKALAMLSPKTEAAFLAEATRNLWQSHANSFTTNVCGVQGPNDGKIISRQINKTGAQSVHRAKFLSQLVKQMPTERAHFNKRLMTIDQPDVRSTDKLTMHFKDGSTAQADCIVGADGIHSHVRNAVLSEGLQIGPQYTGCVCFRAIIPMDKATEVLGAEYAQNCYLLNGPKAGIFSYPVEHGDSLNIIMMYFDHPKWEADTWIVPSNKAELQRILHGWNKTAEGIIEVSYPRLGHKTYRYSSTDIPFAAYDSSQCGELGYA